MDTINTKDPSSLEKKLNIILEFADQIEKSSNPEFIYDSLILTCLGKFLIGKAAIYIYEENDLVLKYFKGFHTDDLPKVIKFSDELDNHNLINPDKEINLFKEKYNFDIVENLGSGSDICGFLFLGSKITGQEFTNEDKKVLRTIINIAVPSIRNLLFIERMQKLNKTLNLKITQMNSLFELGKEFNYLLDKNKISKVLSFAILGNLLVSKYLIFHKNNEKFYLLDGNIEEEHVTGLISREELFNCDKIKEKKEYEGETLKILNKAGIELIVPMIFRSKIIGQIFLGKKKTNLPYTDSDKEFLELLSSMAVISIQNAELFKVSLEKQKLEEDIKIAREIQQNLLPQGKIYSEIFDIEAINVPTRQVGGDYYDLFRISKDKILFLIADVSGKGVAASLIMANCQAFIQVLSKRKNFDLSEATFELNELLCDNLTGGKFVTFFWGILDESNLTLNYVNAGHNPPLALINNNLVKLDKGGMLLGILKHNRPYESEEIKLQKFDRILLFTDGVTEAKDINDNEYGDERLEKLFLNKDKNNCDSMIKTVLDDVQSFTKGAEQFDDITLISIEVK